MNPLFSTRDTADRLSPRIAACSPDGSLVHVARGDTVLSFAVEGGGPSASLRRVGAARTTGPVERLICDSRGPIAVVADGRGATLRRVGARDATLLARLDAPVRDVIAAADGLAVLTRAAAGRPAEIILLDARSGEARTARPAPRGAARLRPGAGETVLTIDPDRRLLRRLDLDPCPPADPADRDDRRPPPSGDPGRGRGCCCCPPGPRDPDDGPRRTPRPPRGDDCEPGDDGVEDGCIRYVVAGSSIICRDVCRPERDPCRRALHARVERIELLGGALFAVTRGGRTLESFDRRTLAPLAAHALPHAGAPLLCAPRAGRLLALAPDLSAVTLFDAPAPQAALSLNIAADVSERVVRGADFTGPRPGPSFALESRSVLIVPIVTPGQNYSGEDADVFAEALRTLLGSSPSSEAPIAKISRYYSEQSDEQQMLSFTVFGADTSDYYTGSPLEIDDALTGYYYGAFEPGGLETFAGLGPSPAEMRFRGDETREVTAVSAVNAGAADGANEFPFTLRFPAAIVRLNLDGASAISIQTTGPDWPMLFRDSSGAPRSLTLDPSALSQNLAVTFPAAGAPYAAEVAALRDALNQMLAASPAAAEFEDIDVVWGRRPGETRGRLYILFRFAPGGAVPRFTSLSTPASTAAFFGVTSDDVRGLPGAATFDLSAPPDDQADAERLAQDYLTLVMRLAEIEDADEGVVIDPKLGGAEIQTGGSAADVLAVTRLRLSEAHGGAAARIEAGAGAGADPLSLATGVTLAGSSFNADQHHTMPDKAAFFEMLYGRMVAAVQADQGGAPTGGWTGFANWLNGFSTVYAIPVEPPPAGASGAWSVSGSPTTTDLRAFVIGLDDPTLDPTGVGEPTQPRWGMNFSSFDASAPAGGVSRMESDTRTFAHELGHTLGLGDQYSSVKFDPTLDYIGSLDLMGNSQANWPHVCAYHKLALGWWDAGARLLIPRPAEGATDAHDFILLPTEWWETGLAAAAQAAFPNSPGLDVFGAAVCDLGGDGGVLATVEARAPGAAFSGSIAPDGAAGRVMALNVLDYGASGRYGQVITDAGPVSQATIDGLLRFRRRIHLLDSNLQAGDSLDFADAPGFPVEGLTLQVLQEAAITVGPRSVPVYRCRIEWTGGLSADVGFADNDEEWRSSDIAIDYVGEDPNNPDSGERTWPDGEPVGQGETVVIPPSGTEPHRVLVRVRNFGVQTARDVRVELYLRDPGGGGAIGGEQPFDAQVIDELPPAGDPASVALLAFDWNVPAGQEPHVCWRAEVRDFRVGEGAASQIIVTDGSPTNNWAQQNIFEADVPYASPPEPLESRFSVTNDGPFTEEARLVPQGLPRGVTLRIRPRTLRVPPYSTRVFSLRFEFDEALIDDPCRRRMDVLLRCLRVEDHDEEPWGASLFRLSLKRRTACVVNGTWYGRMLALDGQLDPPIGVGRVSLRLDFMNGEPARWIDAPLNPGGGFTAGFDTGDVDHGARVDVSAHYRGTEFYAPSTSPTLTIVQVLPAG